MEMDNFVKIASKIVAITSSAGLVLALVPPDVKDYVWDSLSSAGNYFIKKSYSTEVIEFDGCLRNQTFTDAKLYLSRLLNVFNSDNNLIIFRHKDSSSYIRRLKPNQSVVDKFGGYKVRWILRSVQCSKSNNLEILYHYEVVFPSRDAADSILYRYLDFVSEQANSIRQETKVLKLFSMDEGNEWSPVDFSHPSTFDTLVIDPALKKKIVDDLDNFMGRKLHYNKMAITWKRGYLLYGPPGTGKTSMITAMANYLKFDIYELDLGRVCSDYELSRLVATTSSSSIIVVEDIDCCTVGFNKNRDLEIEQSDEVKVTLSALLNVLDGLKSVNAEARIVVFTTNYKDRIDRALLRPGRIDCEFHLSYCTTTTLEILVSKFLNINTHKLLEEIKEFIREVEVTPAEVVGQLMKYGSVDELLEGLVEFLATKKMAKEDIHPSFDT